MTAGEWDCEAYGSRGLDVGALCFFSAQLGERDCLTRAVCVDRMAAERARVFDHIRAGAEAGDPTMVYLAGEFTAPDQLLRGDDE